MQCLGRAQGLILSLFLFSNFALAAGQPTPAKVPVAIVVVDENGSPVAGAQIILQEPGLAEVRLSTDYAGRTNVALQQVAPYSLRVQKPGFYESAATQTDPALREVRAVLNHEQIVTQQVSVIASQPDIDTEQTSDKLTLDLPEIINIPYSTSRDIRNLLNYYPGVIQDSSGLIHVDGSESWNTLYTIDGFDVRSPISGNLDLRVSTDAVRSIDRRSTRYPVEYGRSTGGVVALYTGMGDNKFRFNTTDFIPAVQQNNGLRFDKFVPRASFSGPIVRDRAWFFDGIDVEFDDVYIRELPAGADTDHILRGSNLAKFQVNLTPANILQGGLHYNLYHSPYNGISSLVPQQSALKVNSIALLPYLRDQQSFHHGALLDVGVGVIRFRDGYEPHGNSAYEITPDTALGSYFENLVSHSQRIEGNAALYLPQYRWHGQHSVKAGIDLGHIGFDESVTRAAVNYLREDGTLLRQSTFPATAPFDRHNLELGVYAQDRWTPRTGLLFEPGIRFDFDEIIRRPLFAPRLSVVYAPPRANGKTKISAGIGLYYEHTQIEYLTRAFAGIREDTYFAVDGITPTGPPLETTFTADYGALREARALNWSVGVEQKIPGSIFVAANLIRKAVTDQFTYVDETDPSTLSGNFALTNGREDHDNLVEIEARRSFVGGYALFGAYTHATARTNAAIEYYPTVTMLGPQQIGPLPWDSPNRVLSWGWVPLLLPWFKRNWDLVYTADWRTGFPFTAINANQQVVGEAGGQRFPNYLSLSPGLEWRFHFRGAYFGLRGVVENINNSGDFYTVNNVTDSPHYGQFTQPLGRAFTTRIRLISSKK